MDLVRYAGVGLLPATTAVTTDKISTQALLVVEGPIDDKCRDKVFSTDELERMAIATNEYLASGRSTNLYLSEHSAESGDFVGKVRHGLYTKEITAADLPDPGMTSLIGKTGLFGPVDITVPKGIEVYNGGLRTISVGHDEDGSFVGKDVIAEVSITSFPAIYGASLYSKKTFIPTVTSAGNLLIKGVSATDRKAIVAYGLTIAQTQQEQASAREADAVYNDFDAFLMTIADINREGRDASLLERAIADYTSLLRSRILPSSDPLTNPLPTTFSKEQSMSPEDQSLEPTPDQPTLATYQKQVQDLTQNNVDLKTQLANLERRQVISSTYTRLRNQGESLVRQYKLEPAEFKKLFGGDSDADIENFLNPPEGEKKYNLESVEFYLNTCSTRSPIAPTARQDGTPEEIADPAQDQYEAELATYRKSRGYTTKEAE